MTSKFSVAIAVMLAASPLSDIIIRALWGQVPAWLPFLKLGALLAFSLACLLNSRLRQFLAYAFVLSAFAFSEIFVRAVMTSGPWLAVFNQQSFISSFGSSILLKWIQCVPVVAVLIMTLKSPSRFYLRKGDLSVKARRIPGLVEADTITWGRLATISAVLISLGTILLTMLTVTGFSMPAGMGRLWNLMPTVLLFAMANAFAEGLLFRHTILGTLGEVLPKEQVIFTAAVFFGIPHYAGAPGGIIGMFMSGVLGWYMCRSMYETEGFAAPLIIHFMQDVVIFATFILVSGWR